MLLASTLARSRMHFSLTRNHSWYFVSDISSTDIEMRGCKSKRSIHFLISLFYSRSI